MKAFDWQVYSVILLSLFLSSVVDAQSVHGIPFGHRPGVASVNSVEPLTHVVTVTRSRQKDCETLLLSGSTFPTRANLSAQFLRTDWAREIWRKIPRTPVASSNRFALRHMVNKKVITEEQFSFYSNLIGTVDTRQISIVQVHKLDVDGKLERELRKDPDAVRDKLSFWDFPAVVVGYGSEAALIQTLLGERQSNIWLISGKIKDEGRSESLPVRWMIEYPDLAKRYEKGQMVFEVGRAATLDSHLFRFNVGILANLALSESIRLGQDPSKVILTAHAPSKQNAILYRRGFGMRTVERVSIEPYHEILEVSLMEVLAEFPSGEVFRAVQDLMQATGLSDLDATLVTAHAGEIKNREAGIFPADVTFYRGTVYIQDFSSATDFKLLKLLENKNLTSSQLENGLQVLKQQWQPLDATHIDLVYQIDMHQAISKWPKKDAVVISGLGVPDLPTVTREMAGKLTPPERDRISEAHRQVLINVLQEYATYHQMDFKDPRLLKTEFFFNTRGALQFNLVAGLFGRKSEGQSDDYLERLVNWHTLRVTGADLVALAR